MWYNQIEEEFLWILNKSDFTIETMMVLSKLRAWGEPQLQEDNNNTIKRDILRDSQSALSAHSRCTYFSLLSI